MLTDTNFSPYLDLNTRRGFVEHIRRSTKTLPSLPSLRGTSLRASLKDYSHVLRDTDFEARWDEDPGYTGSCWGYRLELFELIKVTVRTCQRISDKMMTELERDWFTCAWSLVVDVEGMGWEHRVACTREISRIVPLAMKLPDLAFTEEVVANRVRAISAFLTTGFPACVQPTS